MYRLDLLFGRERAQDLRREAARARVGRTAATPVTRVTLRYAAAADVPGLRVLAELDSADPPAGPALVAEIDGRIRAALPLDGGTPIADPFHRGAELVDLLRLRATHLHSA
ncbi:MAG TPA: hypothetical protein VG410_04910 [Solirubrobacteraceae bacterium]|nr:hypothetical protein [Solirubrobacteraceae bacterium]